jgi:hypothetical protein
MDKMNKDKNTSEWVHDCLARLDSAPHWHPDPELGMVRFRSYERMAKRELRLRRAAAVIVLVASVLALAVPATRGLGRQLLDRFYMRRPEAVRSTMPRSEPSVFIMEYTSPTSVGRFVASVEEAQREAGFDPRLPPRLVEQVASGLAVVKVHGAIDTRIKIHVPDLTVALQKRGIERVDVPRNWHGAEIAHHTGPGIWIVFLGGSLGQSPRPSLVTPPNFPLIDFTEIALEAAGLTPSEAHRARNLFADSGGAFSVVPSDAKSDFRDVSLKSGQGLLFENDTDQDERQKCSFCPGPHERVLTWAAADRVFQLRSQTMTVEQAIGLANSID